jgi:hypothetical protein
MAISYELSGATNHNTTLRRVRQALATINTVITAPAPNPDRKEVSVFTECTVTRTYVASILQFTETILADRTSIMEYPDRTKRTTLPDNTVIFEYSTGAIVRETEQPDGIILTEYRDGTKITRDLIRNVNIIESPDHMKTWESRESIVTRMPDDTLITEDLSNGVKKIAYADGSSLVIHKDGTTIAFDSKGTQVDSLSEHDGMDRFTDEKELETALSA